MCLTDALSLLNGQEPPGADPHAGWCGGRGLITLPYPIMPLRVGVLGASSGEHLSQCLVNSPTIGKLVRKIGIEGDQVSALGKLFGVFSTYAAFEIVFLSHINHLLRNPDARVQSRCGH